MQKLLSLIKQGENQTTEFKTSFQKEVIESVVAFANCDGGKILIGIKDNGAIVGVNITNETLKDWINQIKNNTQPQIIVDIDDIAIEKLQSGNYSSRTRNRAIARAFKEAGIIERYGSGIARIKNTPNQRTSQISAKLNIPVKILERWIKRLKDEGKIEYTGSKKTGGYVVKNDK